MFLLSKPRYKWWGYIKGVIREYPELKKQYDELHRQNVTASLTGMPSGGSVSRGTENIAIKELKKPKQAEMEAVRLAIQATERMKTGKDRMRIVQLVFWKQSHTLQGAAMAIPVSYDTAINYHGDFIMTVAYFRGMLTYEELRDSQKFSLRSYSVPEAVEQ